MSYESAEFLLNAFFAGAALIWLVAAAFVRSVARRCDEPLVESVTLARSLPDVPRLFATALVAIHGQTPLARATIQSVDERELHWVSGPRSQFPGRLIVDPDDDRQLTVLIEASFGVRGARIALTVGMIWTIAIYVVLRTFVLPSEIEALRGQVFQMAHAIHGLWPPFLFAAVALTARRKLREDVLRLLQNLTVL